MVCIEKSAHTATVARTRGARVLIHLPYLFLTFRAKMKGFSPWPGRVSTNPPTHQQHRPNRQDRHQTRIRTLFFCLSLSKLFARDCTCFLSLSWSRKRAATCHVRSLIFWRVHVVGVFTSVSSQCLGTTRCDTAAVDATAPARIASAISRHTRPSNSNWRARPRRYNLNCTPSWSRFSRFRCSRFSSLLVCLSSFLPFFPSSHLPSTRRCFVTLRRGELNTDATEILEFVPRMCWSSVFFFWLIEMCLTLDTMSHEQRTLYLSCNFRVKK